MASRGTTKTTRAFRTIGEASQELGLQPHVLRFWESKFSAIQPMKRGGGRRFYRPEDIEFIRGIKKLLHDEGHPIKEVQKLIKSNGPQSIVELGRSVEEASREARISDLDLVPERIRTAGEASVAPPAESPVLPDGGLVSSTLAKSVSFEPQINRDGLVDALARLQALRAKWRAFRDGAAGGIESR